MSSSLSSASQSATGKRISHAPVKRKRKPRPSTARGLRTSTGCLTCRKRRVKCDEDQPRCRNCAKSDRICDYAEAAASPANFTQAAGETHLGKEGGTSHSRAPRSFDLGAKLNVEGAPRADPGVDVDVHTAAWTEALLSIEQHDSPATVRSSLLDYDPTLFNTLDSFCAAPFSWYDLLAADAIDDLQRYKDNGEEFLWNFDETSLSRRLTPVPELQVLDPETSTIRAYDTSQQSVQAASAEPWNSPMRFQLNGEELRYFQHYVSVVGPILDLYDPDKHFTIAVPHLALQNEGLLKSLLAVAARHSALQSECLWRKTVDGDSTLTSQTGEALRDANRSHTSQTATRYYYETLRYLSQTLLYPSYTRSLELLATAIMISTYEMFDAHVSSNSRNWERHLQGAFWIQNRQADENNAESANGLRRAVWWAWLRQDVWAAFQAGRPAMTIWRPKKRLIDLTNDELATRIGYISAKCVQFAASDKTDITAHMEKGKNLLRMLDDWKQILPACFQPIELNSTSTTTSIPTGLNHEDPDRASIFQPIWIHPPAFAAAVQTYHFSRIVVLLHETGTSGPAAYRAKEKMLSESMETICGIAMAEQTQNLPCTFVNLQALFAAGFCTRSPEMEAVIQNIIRKTLEVSQLPASGLVHDWALIWNGSV